MRRAGPDHVDSHRSVALVASPFAKRGFVDHSFYSTSGMLRIDGADSRPAADEPRTTRRRRRSSTRFRATPDLAAYRRLTPERRARREEPGDGRSARRLRER